VLVDAAVAVARDWVTGYAAGTAGFRGAFLAGSVVRRAATDTLPPWSDVDVRVVVAGPLPPKPGKLRHRGVLLDVDVVPAAELADAARVAASFHLAPCFAVAGVLADPLGDLQRLRDAIAPTFATPEAVRRRCADVIDRIERRLAALDPGRPWPELVAAWLFPATLLTNVVLVAALHPPTVRLRFVAARTVLAGAGRSDLYERLLGLVGCADIAPDVVERHLDRLATVFDEAAAVARTPFPFSGDVTPQARPVAIEGSRQLVADGDHREAVFWIVATLARCRQILDADAADPVRRAREFRAAVTELTGIDGGAELQRRTSAALRMLPEVRAVAGEIGGFRWEPDAGARRDG
jgi:hypothetical protein